MYKVDCDLRARWETTGRRSRFEQGLCAAGTRPDP